MSVFETTAQGCRIATSVGGVLTGRGADLIIIDDPLKPEEALSQTQRQAARDWFDNTLYSRLNDTQTGAIIVIMHRLHEDDLAGHVMAQPCDELLDDLAVGQRQPRRPARRRGAGLFLNLLQHVDQHLGGAQIGCRGFVDELGDDRLALGDLAPLAVDRDVDRSARRSTAPTNPCGAGRAGCPTGGLP